MIALDTNIYIYFLERNPEFFNRSEKALKYAFESGPIPVATITLMEIMSGTANKEVLNFFANKQFVLTDLTVEIATLAGQLRYKHKALKAADAIQLSTALANSASTFITNDDRLAQLKLGIKITPLRKVT